MIQTTFFVPKRECCICLIVNVLCMLVSSRAAFCSWCYIWTV